MPLFQDGLVSVGDGGTGELLGMLVGDKPIFLTMADEDWTGDFLNFINIPEAILDDMLEDPTTWDHLTDHPLERGEG